MSSFLTFATGQPINKNMFWWRKQWLGVSSTQCIRRLTIAAKFQSSILIPLKPTTSIIIFFIFLRLVMKFWIFWVQFSLIDTTPLLSEVTSTLTWPIVTSILCVSLPADLAITKPWFNSFKRFSILLFCTFSFKTENHHCFNKWVTLFTRTNNLSIRITYQMSTM